MKTTIKFAACFIILFPYIIAFAPNPSDSAFTEVEFAAGTGSYAIVSRDCNGNVKSVQDVPYSDFGVSVSHKTSMPLRFGASVGKATGARGDSWVFDYGTHANPEPLWYLTPSVGVDDKYFGADVGYLVVLNSSERIVNTDGYEYKTRFSKGLISGRLRLGNRDRVFFSTSLARNVPLLTGGGLFDAGISFKLGNTTSRLWLGIGAFPYDRMVFSAKGEFPISDQFHLFTRAQLGGSESFEYGLAIGGKIIF